MIYTIYKGLLPNGRVKIGCDEAWPNRAIEQTLTDYYVLEEHEDIRVASFREIELQREHGVKVDTIPYYMTKVYAARASRKAQQNGNHNFQTMTKEQRSQNAKKNSIFKNSSFQSEMGKRGKGIPKPHAADLARALNTEWYCEVCDKSGKGKGNWTRYHKNCK